MIPAYRIVSKKWQETAFNGDGAKIYPGRWNSRGVSMTYTAESRALALLEIIVHLEQENILRENFVLIPLKIPSSCIMQIDKNLPKDWQNNPPPTSTRTLGDEWIKSNESLALAVPSILVPQEFNYLINTKHTDFEKLMIDNPQPLDIDKRFTGR